ncbi:hypothetical protein GQ42DRAFT_137180 [Ramicandelaber brevisporus]|nr:hypothetical protein GQ42DRAFT_137180 [Ramicandelaber brevisporus]
MSHLPISLARTWPQLHSAHWLCWLFIVVIIVCVFVSIDCLCGSQVSVVLCRRFLFSFWSCREFPFFLECISRLL